MKILLVGEFSRLHNSLKEGLAKLGHAVTIVGTGDDFKAYSVDYSIYPKWLTYNSLISKLKNGFYTLTGVDLLKLEKGLRFYFLLKKLKGYDHVQFINSDAIETYPAFSRWLYKRLLKQNSDSLSLLICGEDTPIVDYHLDGKARYSILTPYLEDKQLEKTYHYTLKYTTPAYRKLFNWVKHHADVMITTDLDYTLPMQEMGYKVTHIANPVNVDKIKFEPVRVSDKIVIFLGINRLSYIKKGIAYFEEALLKIGDKYADRIEIVVTENLPYAEYMKHYSRAHIVLDQIWGYDQGYNALEAMARGKVVFTCAEKEFMEYYSLNECVALNALPDADYIATELSYLIEHPEKISEIGANARAFIEKEHNYIDVAKRYLEAWDIL